MTTSPVTVPTLQDRASQLAALGWTGREAEWLALVALHSGVFTRAQWRHFFADPHREMVSRFVRELVEKRLAAEDERTIFPRQRAGRAAHGQTDLSGAWGRQRPPSSLEGRDD